MTITAEQFTDCTKGRKGISCRSESKKGHQKKKEASRKEKKLYLLNNSPQTKSNIFSVGEKEERRKLEGEKKKRKKKGDPISLPPPLFTPFSFLRSRSLSSPSLCPAQCFALALCVSGAQ